ncbi:acetyltransferase [Bacillus thuringiensis Bt18247]|uniref:Acetyltransferase n=1 Tax=Bacillus thuringiensis Bt18247 TaxID=1423143 RepID=A0A9W3X912_BACTU|nr:acetyltransferase [Bacillus thuringiensis Bt18247]
MEITLEKATESDAEVIFQMQIDSFSPLLHKYKDYETNPANETIEKTICRINHVDGGFYKIIVAMNLVGAICISQKETPCYEVTFVNSFSPIIFFLDGIQKLQK